MMHRRLPVYLLIDTSASMTGEPIAAVRDGIDQLLTFLRSDPNALETAYLSVIEFNSKARQLHELSELTEFQAPPLKAQGMTAMGEALMLLVDCIQREVMQPNRRDWQPIVFLLTDGLPNDDLQAGLDALKRVRLGMCVACAAGPQANVETLQKIAEVVVRLEQADHASIGAFFQWVSASIATSSQKVEHMGTEVAGMADLPPPPAEIGVVDMSGL